jgi:hypothetical protein
VEELKRMELLPVLERALDHWKSKKIYLLLSSAQEYVDNRLKSL